MIVGLAAFITNNNHDISPKANLSMSVTRKQNLNSSHVTSKSQSTDNQMMGGKKIVISNNGSMIVQNRREGTDQNGVDEHKLE